MSRRRCSLSASSLLSLLVFVAAYPACAAGPFAVSPDVTLPLGGSPQTVGSGDVAVLGPGGKVALVPLGTLPAGSNVTGYHGLANGDVLLCFDSAVELPGGVTAQPGDVVRHGLSYTIEMAAAANGIPPGASCDALTADSTGKLVMSFDVSVALPPSYFVADDEDLVRLASAGNWDFYVDGSALGIPPELDVDGAIQLANGNLDLSLDGSGEVFGPVHFDDEDVIEWNTDAMSWSLAFDGSANDPDWAAADVDALPEPRGLTLLISGAAALLGLGKWRTR